MGEASISYIHNAILSSYKSVGRVYSSSMPSLETSPQCSIKWNDLDEIPELGKYVCIISENIKYKWLGIICSVETSNILSDYGAEVELRKNPNPLKKIRDQVGDLIVKVELLNCYTFDGLQTSSKQNINSSPQYGDHVFLDTHLWKELIYTSLGKRLESIRSLNDSLDYWEDVADSIALSGKRTLIFGKTGSGKTNLSKKLLQLQIENEHDAMVIFDTQGEFISTDDQNFPFITKKVADKLTIFSNRSLDDRLSKKRVSPIKFDLSEMTASEAFNAFTHIILKGDEKWPQFISRLDKDEWNELCKMISENSTYKTFISSFMDKFARESQSENMASVVAAGKQLYDILVHFHLPDFPLKLNLCHALANKQVVIFDFSDLSPDRQGKIIEYIIGVVLDYNRAAYTKNARKSDSDIKSFTYESGKLVPCLNLYRCMFVIDEAQLIFNGRGDDRSPSVRLFKEGRKYGLSSVLMTQQPSSLPIELLSQSENIYSFEMTSADDLFKLSRVNELFSKSILFQIKYNKEPYFPLQYNLVLRS